MDHLKSDLEDGLDHGESCSLIDNKKALKNFQKMGDANAVD